MSVARLPSGTPGGGHLPGTVAGRRPMDSRACLRRMLGV